MSSIQSQRTRTEVFRFAQVSILSFALNLGITYALCEFLNAPEELAFAAALGIVFVTNFLLLRYYIFSSVALPAWSQLTKFAVATIFFRGFEYVSFLGLHTMLGVQYLVAIIAVLGVSFCLKFVVNKSLVFD